MSLWDPYNLSELPEGVRAEVVKTLISETEATKRKKIEEREKTIRERMGSSYHQAVRGAACAAAVILGISFSVLANSVSGDVREVKFKAIAATATPCPPAPPCPTPAPQAFDVHVTPAASPPPAPAK